MLDSAGTFAVKRMKKYRIGYTQGVFDMFHIGHLNILKRAKEQCEILIVGVNSDKLVESYKNKTPVIDEESRRIIVENIKAVDDAIIVHSLDKVELLKEIHFDAVFIGDDWKGNERWILTEQQLAQYNIPVVFLPHTPDISSTGLKKEEPNRVKGE